MPQTFFLFFLVERCTTFGSAAVAVVDKVVRSVRLAECRGRALNRVCFQYLGEMRLRTECGTRHVMLRVTAALGGYAASLVFFLLPPPRLLPYAPSSLLL